MPSNTAAEFQNAEQQNFNDDKNAALNKKNNDDFFAALQYQAVINHHELQLLVDRNIRIALDRAVNNQQERMAEQEKAQNQQRAQAYEAYLKETYAQHPASMPASITVASPLISLHPAFIAHIRHWTDTVWKAHITTLAATLTSTLTHPLALATVPPALAAAMAMPAIKPVIDKRFARAKDTIKAGLIALPSLVEIVAQNPDLMHAINAESTAQESEETALARLATGPAARSAAHVYESAVIGLIRSIMQEFYQDASVIVDQVSSPDATGKMADSYVQQNRASINDFTQGARNEFNRTGLRALVSARRLAVANPVEQTVNQPADSNESTSHVQRVEAKIYPNPNALFQSNSSSNSQTVTNTPSMQVEHHVDVDSSHSINPTN